jgi:low temperature requirement protein LtrA
LLGESVVAVMRGMRSQQDWTPVAALSAFAGMGLLFLVWWWYFDLAAAASERFVRTRRDAVRINLWSYAHFPLYVGLVVTAVGVQRSVTAARWAVYGEDAVLMSAAAATVVMAMTVIGGTFDRRPGSLGGWLAGALERRLRSRRLRRPSGWSSTAATTSNP